MKTLKISAQLTPADEGGYVVYCPELDITTEGDNLEEAIEMIKDAAKGYIEVVGIDNIPYFANNTIKKEVEIILNE